MGVITVFVPEPALAGGEDLLEVVVGIVAVAELVGAVRAFEKVLNIHTCLAFWNK